MKTYIIRRGKPDFVANAPTIGDAIVMLWLATGEIPRAAYRVHHGRRRQSRIVSAAVAYWRLSIDVRPLLRAVIEDTSPKAKNNEFVEHVLTAAELLGK